MSNENKNNIDNNPDGIDNTITPTNINHTSSSKKKKLKPSKSDLKAIKLLFQKKKKKKSNNKTRLTWWGGKIINTPRKIEKTAFKRRGRRIEKKPKYKCCEECEDDGKYHYWKNRQLFYEEERQELANGKWFKPPIHHEQLLENTTSQRKETEAEAATAAEASTASASAAEASASATTASGSRECIV